MQQNRGQSVADVKGPWVDSGFDSQLIDSLKRNWTIPVAELTNEALARFIRQRIALRLILPEARQRIETCFTDYSEMYEGQLANALNDQAGNVQLNVTLVSQEPAMIRAVYRDGTIRPLDQVPNEWHEGENLIVSQANESAEAPDSDNWLAELNAAAAQIPDDLHEQLSKALDEIEAESKEFGRREMERSE